MSEAQIIANAASWAAYTKRLDEGNSYSHRHNDEPDSYPCIVLSRFWDDPNGPYTYDHEFVTLDDAKALIKVAQRTGGPDAKAVRHLNPLTSK